MASGKTREYFWLGVIGSAFQVVCIIGGGLLWGTMGVAAGISMTGLFSCALFNYFGLRLTQMANAGVLPKLAMDYLYAILWGLALVAVRYAVGWSLRVPWIFPFAIVGAAAYIGLWIAIPGGKKRVLNYISYARRIFVKS
jgi:O-antigen/teichoic acid export membrane protein